MGPKRWKVLCNKCKRIFDSDYKKKHESRYHNGVRQQVRKVGAPVDPFSVVKKRVPSGQQSSCVADERKSDDGMSDHENEQFLRVGDVINDDVVSRVVDERKSNDGMNSHENEQFLLADDEINDDAVSGVGDERKSDDGMIDHENENFLRIDDGISDDSL